MLLKVCDIFTTIVQAFLIAWICNNIASNENRISKAKSYILMLTIFVVVVIFTYSSINTPTSNLIMMIIILLSTILFYRKSIIDALLGFGFFYSLTIMSSYLLFTFYQNVLSKLNFKISEELQFTIFIYVPSWILYFFIIKFRKHIFNAAIYLKNLKNALIFAIIAVYLFIFMDTLRIHLTVENMEAILKIIIYLTTFITFVFAIIYFAKINDKNKEVEMLNIALSDKITELKKIKHDYGSEISSLYGLYQLGKIDRIGELLKGIVESYQGLNHAVNINVNATPLVASVLQSAASKGINVVTFDSGDYENLSITDNELLKVLSNIVKNSVDILKDVDNPIIKFKSYNSYNGIIFTIVNNGPEIPKEIRNRIFESGFSTKGNRDGDRGYGLSIVSDIINKCNGKISVDSDKYWTEFKIEVPYNA
jgi:two-component system, LytTR family, sensor histidine kinase AgrC